MEIYKKYFGQRLREGLERVGLNQSRLAELLQVESSTVSRWANGKDFPDDSRLPEICRHLKIDESFFLSFDQKPAASVESLIEALGAFSEFWLSASEGERKALQGTLNRKNSKKLNAKDETG